MVFVTGLGLVTALGHSAADTWTRLLAGESGLRLRQPFPELSGVPLGLVGESPGNLTDLLLAATREALADAQLPLSQPDCGVVIGSSRSFQGQWEQGAKILQTQGALPPDWPWMATLPHQGAIATAQYVGATGPILAPMAACATGLWAIFQGAELIRQGRCQRVVVGAADAPITPLTLTGFQQLGALAPTGCYPFSAQRQGLALAEGAAVLMLESADSLRERPGVQPYGRILGAGFSADAHHVTAPDPQQRGSRLAIEHCLQRSGLLPTQVDYIHAHGTGTRLNDAHESSLITRMFPHLPPVSSTKGATGHTLGASGAIGAAFCLLALRTQQLPPNVGLTGTAIYPNLVHPARSAAVNTTLCLSFGFGGQNAVLALGQASG